MPQTKEINISSNQQVKEESPQIFTTLAESNKLDNKQQQKPVCYFDDDVKKTQSQIVINNNKTNFIIK